MKPIEIITHAYVVAMSIVNCYMAYQNWKSSKRTLELMRDWNKVHDIT